MARHVAAAMASGLVAACLATSLVRAFVPGGAGHSRLPASSGAPSTRTLPATEGAASAEPARTTGFPSLLAGCVLGLAVAVGRPLVASADIEDTPIPVDGKGKTTFLSKEQYVRGKRLFASSCATCHVGGGTRTNQNVGLGLEELDGAEPPRNNVESLVSFLNAPMTYDGLADISETHPSIKSADLFPKMRSMKQQDLYDISCFMLYQTATIPEKWGGGKTYY